MVLSGEPRNPCTAFQLDKPRKPFAGLGKLFPAVDPGMNTTAAAVEPFQITSGVPRNRSTRNRHDCRPDALRYFVRPSSACFGVTKPSPPDGDSSSIAFRNSSRTSLASNQDVR